MSGLEQSTRMAWAILSETGSIVHVSMLGKAQKGLLCGCVCPSCKGTLQAVNVDKDATHFAKPNTRGQFFRMRSINRTPCAKPPNGMGIHGVGMTSRLISRLAS